MINEIRKSHGFRLPVRHALLASLVLSICFGSTYSSAQEDYPMLIPDPGPSFHTPFPPNDGTSFGNNAFVLNSPQSSNNPNQNYPNPAATEDITDNGVNVGTLSYGASYGLGPAGTINITNPRPNCTYSLTSGPHQLKFFGITAIPGWHNQNWEQQAGAASDEITLGAYKVWAGSFVVNVAETTTYQTHYYEIEMSNGTQHLHSHGEIQVWDKD